MGDLEQAKAIYNITVIVAVVFGVYVFIKLIPLIIAGIMLIMFIYFFIKFMIVVFREIFVEKIYDKKQR
ncbi:MAG: hypothetical protein MR601_01045 [Erysipelotrichaceae bacterium]|nr:hypothetical protein [Erysipelotrichaceae bacterium]